MITVSTAYAQSPDYFVMDGTIGKTPIRMELNTASSFKENGEKAYSGIYYYKSQGIPIEIVQNSLSGNYLELVFFPASDETGELGIFKGRLEKGSYKGQWENGNTVLQFDLKPVVPSAYTHFKLYQSRKVIPALNLSDSLQEETSIELRYMLPEDWDFQKELMKKVTKSFSDFDKFSEKTINSFEKQYNKDVKNVLKNGFYGQSLFYNNYSSLIPFFNSVDYLIMMKSDYEYTGGAHGFSSETYYNYNKKSGKWLEIKDILDFNKQNEILKVLDQQLRKDYKIPNGVKYSEAENSIFINDQISISDNFFLTKQGITFCYGLYDMTPYVYGFFHLTVSYEDLKPYLKAGFSY